MIVVELPLSVPFSSPEHFGDSLFPMPTCETCDMMIPVTDLPIFILIKLVFINIKITLDYLFLCLFLSRPFRGLARPNAHLRNL